MRSAISYQRSGIEAGGIDSPARGQGTSPSADGSRSTGSTARQPVSRNIAMFLRVLAGTLKHRRGRMALALIALAVGSSVATAMLSVYYDADRKMTQELRAYGANVMLSPSTGSLADQTIVDKLAQARWPAEIVAAAPYLYTVDIVDTSDGPVRVVVAGTWFDQARRANPWWKINGQWIEDRSDRTHCIIGVHLAKRLGVALESKINISYGSQTEPASTGSGTAPADASPPNAIENRAAQFQVWGVLDSGGSEDDQVFVTLGAAQSLAGLDGKISVVAVSAAGSGDRVRAFASGASTLPGVRGDLVLQIAESEGHILSRIRATMLLVTLFILAAAALAVSTTLTAQVVERRKEIATMRAIGGSQSQVMALFLAELGALALAGGALGYVWGILMAQPIGRSLFNSPVSPRPVVLLIVLPTAFAVALLSALLPMKRMREVAPALILKGD